MSLGSTEIAVLCALKDYGAMTARELADEIPGAIPSLQGLGKLGYIESRGDPTGAVSWRLTDKGQDFVEGDT